MLISRLAARATVHLTSEGLSGVLKNSPTFITCFLRTTITTVNFWVFYMFNVKLGTEE